MAQTFEAKLLHAIEKDDIKAFNALMEEAQCGRYRLGRFPVLSLMYLYNSRAIIMAHEENFIKMSNWEELSEPAGIVKRFSAKAGKSLRLYLDEVVSPLEMLLILDKTRRLKKVFPLTNPSKAVKSRLQSVYSIKYSLNIKYEGDQIILDRRPLNRREKQKIMAACLGFFLAAAVIIVPPVTCDGLLGKRSGGDVTRLSHIDFGARTTYTLKKDITIPENYSVKKVNCTIIGGDHKKVLGRNASLGQLNGKLKNLKIQTSGTPIFTVCAQSSALSAVTINVNANVSTNENSALVAITNYGTFDGVTMNVGGKISAFAGVGEELIFGGMVAGNANTIKNCTVNYSDFHLEGESVANATFGGIVGVNNGIVQDCAVTGKIVSDTFDLAGVCYLNYSELSGIINEADLSQTSTDGWYPVVGGIVIDNVGIVEYCRNTGNITIDGQYEATCGGIAARTYWEVIYSVSGGDITITAPTAYAGGIFGVSGIAHSNLTYYFGYADHCIVEGKMTLALGKGTSYVGGIGGYIHDHLVDQINKTYIGGSILNCIFMGKTEGDFNYFGNILGVCGENIYEKNSYTSNNNEYLIFDGNYYVENSKPSFGAVEKIIDEAESEFVEVEGKGAESKTEAEIKNSEIYKDILKELGM